ncbi:superinfection immunity protein [Sphingomonas aliaeris]|uniref:Superinfection immunity protein n=1 Tax=Sphingomonas aliaeris TaxID=2759526 RepID=A0A974NSZ6_9SPHN|nr:superinfection immunity protein [Sphingomonas aliaeris]QQV76341.1 superinfection immunity protein [Sphingomonas aliaeris]
MPYKALAIVALVVFVLAIVGLPAAVAMIRNHPERRLIYKLTPLTALSFILWGVLLAWAITGIRDDAVMSRLFARARRSRYLPTMIGGLVLVGMVGTALTL